LAIDVVIHTSGDDIWLVRRKDTSELATMGGFVDVGETVESAVERELQEEMGINASSQASRIRLLGIYSDPQRDNRRHTVSAVFSIRLDGSERPKAADDVKQVKRISLATVESHKYFADHRAILLDYRTWWYSLSKEDQIGAYHAREGSLQHPPEQGATHFPSRVVRSLC
jgi:8-oxo-dGTP diphosphatase